MAWGYQGVEEPSCHHPLHQSPIERGRTDASQSVIVNPFLQTAHLFSYVNRELLKVSIDNPPRLFGMMITLIVSPRPCPAAVCPGPAELCVRAPCPLSLPLHLHSLPPSPPLHSLQTSHSAPGSGYERPAPQELWEEGNYLQFV